MFRPLPICLSLGLSLLVSAVTVACANSSTYHHPNYQQDGSVQYFNEMQRAKDNSNALSQYQQRMQGCLFEMYPTYLLLNQNLANQNASTIADFTRRYQGSVMGEKLAADYAEVKAEQGDWASILQVADLIENADASEACAIALGYHRSNQSYRALEQKPKVWLNTQAMPVLCRKLADELNTNAYISFQDRHERLVRLIRIDGRRLYSSRPADDTKAQIVALATQLGLPINHQTLANISNNPSAFLSQFHAMPFSETNQYLYLYAISQMTHRSYREAIRQLENDIAQDDRRSTRLLSDLARRYAYRSIAVKRMNKNTDDGFGAEAVDWFNKSLGEPFNFEEAEDYAQAAIYFGRWQDVYHAIAAMDTATQNERIWQYWQARSLEMLGNVAQAQALYRKLGDEIDYYGLLAKDRLGQRVSVQEIGGTQMPVANNAQVMSDPHFARAILLMQNNAERVHIDREWNWAVKKARDAGNIPLILSAARMAYELGNYPRAIYALENSNARNGAISHPLLHQSAVQRHSYNVGISPAWTYGVIRQESRFQTAVQSSAKAQGLMQIIPSTAQEIARGIGERAGNMSDADTNIRYGTRYLSNLSDKLGGQPVVVTAAYNAGAVPARAWLPKHGVISADQYVEAIPYGETRNYVKQVMANTAIYGVQLGESASISQRMAMVSPR